MKKSKIFARKVIAMLIAVIMAASTFTSVLTVYAKSTDDAHDKNLAANFMAWAETTDNQTCEALLDWADETLQKANIAPIIFEGNYVVVNIQIHGYLDSIDGVIDLARQADGLLDQYGGLLGGDINNINLDALVGLPSITSGDGIISKCNRSYRAANDAKTIVMALAKQIYWLSNDNTASGHTNKNVIGQFIKGNLSLGSILNGVVDVYGLIGDALGMWSGYQSNLVYNILAQLILTKTNWFTEAEVKDFQSYLQGNGGSTWNFDVQLLSKLTDAFINKISVTMTYALEKSTAEDGTSNFAPTDSSKTRYSKIKAYLSENGMAETDANVRAAVVALNKANGTDWDENLRYDLGDGMIYIFQYWNGSSYDGLEINPDTRVFDLVDDALALAWKTVLRPTFRTLRVNSNMDWYEDHGGNFDNQYYYWLAESGNLDKNNVDANYTIEKFNKYAEAVMGKYGCSDVEEFTAKVKKTFDYDRNVVDDPTYTWRDIDKSCNYTTESGSKESILFGKLRYSPLADKVFNMQTGPINLYIMQTGFANFEAFMDDYTTDNSKGYKNLVDAANDALVAVAKDFFPDSKNIGLGTDNEVTTNIARPTMATTGANTSVLNIATTLVNNVCKMFEYGCNVTDENLLNIFYHDHNITNKTSSSNLTETNFEEAMVPLAIACIRIISMTRTIHDSDWDYAKDAEGVGFVALREYLSYSLPKKDYNQLITTANGKYEAAKDVDGDGKKDLYLDVLLPMARDAVGYLLNSIVPCRTKDGKVWNVYESDPATDKTTLFDILNSVICYYASTEEFTEPSWNTTASKTYGKGVAALLGAVDNNGVCTVKMSNSIWTNIDNVANKLWPTLGTIQYGVSAKAGQFNSEELIYTKVVKSLLNIGTVQESTGKGGVTTIVAQLLTMFTTEPVMNKGIDVLIYDEVVASIANGIFGKRTSSQTYSKVLPTSSDMGTNTPFDSLVNRPVFALYKGDGDKENGILGNLVSNIYGDLGGDAECGSTFATNSGAGCWQGAMFAVKAVSYFIDGFIPQLGDHQFNAASVSVNDPSRSNIAAGSAMAATTVTLKNEAVGLNRFYKDAKGNIVADDRYFVEVVDLSYEAQGAKPNFTMDSPNGRMIAPEGTIKVNLKGSNPTADSLVTFKFTYNVYLGTQENNKKEKLYENQVATCYLNLSTEGGWAGSVLDQSDSDSGSIYPGSDSDYTDSEYDEDGNTVSVYNNLVISNNNVEQINDFGIAQSGLNGLYAADDNGNAYVAFDPSTGDVLNVDMYDYKIGENGTWQRGSYVTIGGVRVYKGLTESEVKSATSGQSDVATRTHVAVSLAEAGAVITSTTKDASGKYTSVTVNPAVITNECATAATPTHGINFLNFAGTEAGAPKWLKYDGTTSIAAETYEMNLCGYNDAGTYALGTTTVIIADTNGANDLQRTYENYLAEMSPYQPTDYKDYNKTYSSSATNDALQQTFQNTVKAISAPVTLENASKLISTSEIVARTSQTKSATGDVAFKPATTVTGDLAKSVYKKGSFYYIDEACTLPVYSNQYLTDADVTNGKDATGQAVDKQGDYYYLVNDNSYEYEWDATTYAPYPYYKQTSTVAQYNDGTDEAPVMKNYYEQVQYMYFTVAGKQVSSAEDWDYKYAITDSITKKNSGKNDYRGYYEKLTDALTYNVQEAKKNVDTSLITMITEDIIADRAGKESVNYDVATYEKMVQIAKQGEKLVSDTGKKDAEGNKIYSTNASSVEIKEANRLYKKYHALVIARGYEGNKLEAEINHLTGTTKDNIAVVAATETADASVALKAGKPAYGTLVNGVIVNDGSYSDETWSDFINALAAAVIQAKAAPKEDIAGTYSAKKNVVRAENALAAPEAATSYTFSGKVVAATDGKGTAGTTAVAGAKLYVGKTLVATAAADGTFTAKIDLGTTDITVKAANGIDRTVTLAGDADVTDAVVGIVVYDYNADGKVNAVDAALMAKAKATVDKTAFKNILKTGVKYSATL